MGYYGRTVTTEGYLRYCGVLGGYGVLGSNGGNWWILWGTMGYCVVLWGYYMALLVTAGYFWVQGWGYLGFWGVIENSVLYCGVL